MLAVDGGFLWGWCAVLWSVGDMELLAVFKAEEGSPGGPACCLIPAPSAGDQAGLRGGFDLERGL